MTPIAAVTHGEGGGDSIDFPFKRQVSILHTSDDDRCVRAAHICLRRDPAAEMACLQRGLEFPATSQHASSTSSNS